MGRESLACSHETVSDADPSACTAVPAHHFNQKKKKVFKVFYVNRLFLLGVSLGKCFM